MPFAFSLSTFLCSLSNVQQKSSKRCRSSSKEELHKRVCALDDIRSCVCVCVCVLLLPQAAGALRAMELLSASRLEGIRLIREQLCCMLWYVRPSIRRQSLASLLHARYAAHQSAQHTLTTLSHACTYAHSERIFDDPQCLDCKHNFCRECIYVHLRKNESKCPTCKIPIFPSEIMRNQFLESILVAWKAVEKELSVLDANRIEFGLTTADADRVLGGLAASTALSSTLASPTQSAATSSGAAIAAALVGTTPSRGPVANRKWNVNTAAILNEQKQPKRVTGIAASPMRATSRATAVTEASQANGDDTPGPTQMTQMTQMTDGAASRNGTRLH